MENRKEIREKYREIRDALPKEHALELSEQACRRIVEWDVYQKAERILVYYPIKQELSLFAVIEDAIKQGKQLAFPKVVGKEMYFYETKDLEAFQEGIFHVMEPVTDESQEPVEWERALCLVPGVVFDWTGGRMGYGKGYYDRYLASHPGNLRAGCAYHVQIIKELPMDKWDQPMDYIISDQGVIRTQERSLG